MTTESTIDLGLFAYPWDIQLQGYQAFIDEIKSLGITRVVVCVTYHSAEIVRPRLTGPGLMTVEPNVCHLPVSPDAFSGISVASSTFARIYPDFYFELARECAAEGISLDAWLVMLHNSRLAADNPHAAMVNCFGERSQHGICPSHPSTRSFVLELVTAVQAAGVFDRVFLESLSYLPYGHGHPHELSAVRTDAVTRLLLSLCFCGHCTRELLDRGVDAEAERRWVVDELRRRWNSPLSQSRVDDGDRELGALLLHRQGLRETTTMRMSHVSELTRTLGDRVRSAGGALEICSAVFEDAVGRNFVEGIDVARALEHADRFVLCCYWTELERLACEIDTVRALSPSGELAAALELWPVQHGSRTRFLDKLDLLLDSGIRSVKLYNHGTAPAPSLQWAAEAAHRMARMR